MGVFVWTQERVRIGRGKWAISVRATEVLLYMARNPEGTQQRLINVESNFIQVLCLVGDHFTFNTGKSLTCTNARSHACMHTQKEVTSQTDLYLVSLSSKTYVFEDKMTKY